MSALGWLRVAGGEKWHLAVTTPLAAETGCFRYRFKVPNARDLRDVPPVGGLLCSGCTASKYARGAV